MGLGHLTTFTQTRGYTQTRSYNAPAQAAAGAGTLQAAGIRYVIVHWWAFTDAEAAAMRAKLAAVFPGRQPQDDPADRMAIYRLGP